MKFLGQIAVVGVMAMLLAACGQEAPKQPEVKTPNAPVTAPHNAAAPEAAPAAPAEPAAPTAPETQEAPAH